MGGGWRDRTLLDLLTEHGLELSPEHAFPTDGWSGATFTGLVDPVGRHYVLKRTSLAADWIATATRDEDLREGWLAARPTGALAWLPRTSIAYLGAAADGEGVAILMPDLSTELIAWERPGHDPVIDDPTLRRVIESIARLHAMPWSRVDRTSIPSPSTSSRSGAEPARSCGSSIRRTVSVPCSTRRGRTSTCPSAGSVSSSANSADNVAPAYAGRKGVRFTGFRLVYTARTRRC